MTPNKIIRNLSTWFSRVSGRTMWAAGSLLLGIGAGIGSAVISLNTVGLSDAKQPGDWQEWNLSDESLTLPYALGHFLNAGQVPPTKSSRQFVRRVDDTGRGLDGTCVIVLSGTLPAARWWTLSAAASDGTLITDRSVLSAGQAILEANGRLVAHVSASPVPGNWITASTRGSVLLVLTIHDATGAIAPAELPALSQEPC